jgi:predicted membrane protein (TIGR00267 family)
LNDYLKQFRFYLKVTGAAAISRRYFVMNAFDGALTALGVIVGAWSSGPIQPRFIVGAGLGMSLAMGISGFAGAYLTERAERLRRLRELERSLLIDLGSSIHGRAFRTVVLWTAFVDAMSPALTSIASISPFIMLSHGLVSADQAVFISITTIFVILFSLGAFTGRVSKESILISGIRMLSVGLITAFIVSILAR